MIKRYAEYDDVMEEDENGLWCKSEDVEKIEKQNEELIEFIIKVYKGEFKGFEEWIQEYKYRELLEKIKQKPIEEILEERRE